MRACRAGPLAGAAILVAGCADPGGIVQEVPQLDPVEISRFGSRDARGASLTSVVGVLPTATGVAARMLPVGMLALGCLVGLLPPLAADAQTESPDPTRVWVAAGPLTGGADGLRVGLGGTIQLTAQRGPHHVALRAVGMGDVVGGSDDSVSDLALLYGRTATTTFGYAAFGGGPAWVTLSACDDIRQDCRTAGLTATAEAGLQTMVIGVAVQAFGNLNTHAPYAGLGVLVLLGWMP